MLNCALGQPSASEPTLLTDSIVVGCFILSKSIRNLFSSVQQADKSCVACPVTLNIIKTVFDLYEYCMDQCNKSSLSIRPSIVPGKNLKVEHYAQTVQPTVCMPAVLIGTIDYLKPLSVILTLARGQKVSAKQNLLASFSRTLFS